MIPTFLTHPRTIVAARATRLGVWALFVVEALSYGPAPAATITVSPALLVEELRVTVALTLLFATAFSFWVVLITAATETTSSARRRSACARAFVRAFTAALAAPLFAAVLALAVCEVGAAVCLVQLAAVGASYLLVVAASELDPSPLLERSA